jgi:hypothetical protein
MILDTRAAAAYRWFHSSSPSRLNTPSAHHTATFLSYPERKRKSAELSNDQVRKWLQRCFDAVFDDVSSDPQFSAGMSQSGSAARSSAIGWDKHERYLDSFRTSSSSHANCGWCLLDCLTEAHTKHLHVIVAKIVGDTIRTPRYPPWLTLGEPD